MITLFYDLLFVLPFSAALTLLLQPYCWPEQKMLPVLIVCLISSVLLLLLKDLQNRGRIWLSGSMVTIILAILLLQPSEELTAFLLAQIWILQILLISLAALLLHLLQERYRMLRLLFAFGGCIAITVMSFYGFSIEKPAVAALLLYLLLALANELQYHSGKEGDTDPKKHLTGISPFLLLLFLCIQPAKVPEDPYDWGFVRSIAAHISNTFHGIGDRFFAGPGWDSGTPRIGFSDRGDFADSFTTSDYNAISLDLKNSSDPQLYLAGRHFDTFDGQHWSKTDQSDIDQQGLDTIETMAAVLSNENILYPEDLMRRHSMEVAYDGLRSACLFSLPKNDPVRGINETEPQRTGGDLDAADGKKAKQKYTVFYYSLNRDHELFAELLSSAHTITEGEWNAALEQCKVMDPSDYSYDDYLAYHRMINDTYLQPVTLSPELQAYMDVVLDGADSNHEKLLRIETLLRSFRYTDTPGALPSDISNASDFLDYLILEKQDGYCSYYATAFVLLARAYGLPARYVQGFCVPSGVITGSKATVLSSYAHAWPEVYLEGIGWLVFEPTPGKQRFVRWSTTEERCTHIEGAGNSLSENELSEETEEEEAPRFILHWYHIVIPISAGLLLVLLLLAIDQLIRRIRYDRMNAREKGLWLCRRNIDALKRMHLVREDGETLEEFANRVSEQVGEEATDFCSIYELLLYGRKEPTEEDLCLLLEGEKRLLQLHHRTYRVKPQHRQDGII